MVTRASRVAGWLVVACLGPLGGVACQSSSSSGGESASPPAPTASAAAMAAAPAAGGPLKGVCPDKIVIQTDWYATPERAMAYQLVGPDGVVDKKKGTYGGPLPGAGIDAEWSPARAGRAGA